MIIGVSGKIGSGKDTVGKIIQYLTFNDTDLQNICGKHKYTFNDFIISKGFYQPKSSFEIKKFAFAVKQVCSILTGIPIEDFEKEEIKNRELPYDWTILKELFSFTGTSKEWTDFCEDHRFDNSFYPSGNVPLRITDRQNRYTYFKDTCLTVRKLLQKVGTDAIRNVIHPDAWVIALMNQYKTLDYNSYYHQFIVENGFQEDWKIQEAYEHDKKEFYPNWIITDVRFPNEYNAISKRSGILIRVNRTKTLSDKVKIGTNMSVQLVEIDHSQHSSEVSLDYHEFHYTINNNGTIEELIEKVKEILIKEKII